MEIIQNLGNLGLIPVIKIHQAEAALDLGRALVSGGLPCAEITFRTDAAEAALASMAAHLPEIVLGAGTVVSVDQAQRAVNAGAQYIVAPGFNQRVVEWCLSGGIPVIPGIATPTDIEQAMNLGLTTLKFFPAEALGGIQLLQAIAAPYAAVDFIPTGGISSQNLADYIQLPMVLACGGSWLVQESLIANGDFDRIEQLSREARQIIETTRNPGS